VEYARASPSFGSNKSERYDNIMVDTGNRLPSFAKLLLPFGIPIAGSNQQKQLCFIQWYQYVSRTVGVTGMYEVELVSGLNGLDLIEMDSIIRCMHLIPNFAGELSNPDHPTFFVNCFIDVDALQQTQKK
jgi:hypothetical protein